MNWTRAVGYGAALWAIPFALSLALFGIHETNRALFESLITVVGVGTAVLAAFLFFRDTPKPGARQGLILGLMWAAMSVVIDLPIFLFVFRMGLFDYTADIALTYLAFPAITTGLAAAQGRGRAG